MVFGVFKEAALNELLPVQGSCHRFFTSNIHCTPVRKTLAPAFTVEAQLELSIVCWVSWQMTEKKGTRWDINCLIKGSVPQKNFFAPGFKKHNFKGCLGGLVGWASDSISAQVMIPGIVEWDDNSIVLETHLLIGFIILTPRLPNSLSLWNSDISNILSSSVYYSSKVISWSYY